MSIIGDQQYMEVVYAIVDTLIGITADDIKHLLCIKILDNPSYHIRSVGTISDTIMDEVIKPKINGVGDYPWVINKAHSWGILPCTRRLYENFLKVSCHACLYKPILGKNKIRYGSPQCTSYQLSTIIVVEVGEGCDHMDDYVYNSISRQTIGIDKIINLLSELYNEYAYYLWQYATKK